MTDRWFQATSSTSSTTRKRRAELVFIESPRGDSWRARLVNEAGVIDQQTGKPAVRQGVRQYRASITATTSGFAVITQGPHVGSRRRGWFPTLTEAQAALMSWARRRFYQEES